MARTRVSEAQISLYEGLQQDFKLYLERLAKEYLAGSLNISEFSDRMRSSLKQFYISVALVAKGRKTFTTKDKEDLRRLLGLAYGYLDGFIEDLRNYKRLSSDQGVISRTSSYGIGWGVFSRFSLPGEVVDLLPELPGLSCIGGENCGCILEHDIDREGFKIYWIINPFKHNCIVCLDLAVEWQPYEISFEEIGEDYDEWFEEWE